VNDDEMEAQMEYWKGKAEAAEAERDEARTQLADYANVTGEQYDYDTLLAKYGEKCRDLREYQGYARDLRVRAEAAKARVAALEKAAIKLNANAKLTGGEDISVRCEDMDDLVAALADGGEG
jgi:DNA repair ATPase RecN